MKLADLLDTKPFNVFTVTLALLIAASIILTPYAVRGTWREVAGRLTDNNLSTFSLSFEGLNWSYPENPLQQVDYSAYQSVTIQD